MSKAAWALVLIMIIGVVAIIVAAALGFIDLAPVGDGLVAVYMWASMDIVNAVLISIALPLVGILLFWVVQRYFIGQKVTTTAGIGSGGYNPAPVYPSSNPSQKDTETTIS